MCKMKIKLPRLPWYMRILLYLAAAGFCVCSVMQAGYGLFHESIGLIIYVLAGGLLGVSVFYLYGDLRYGVKKAVMGEIEAHPFTRRMVQDYRYRAVLVTVPSILINFAYTFYNGLFGIINRSVWFITMAVYYSLLAGMRYCAVRQEQKIKYLQEDAKIRQKELFVLQVDGFLFLLLTFALFGSVYLMITYEYARKYSEVMVIAVAAYTFYKITMAMIHFIRVRKMKSPLLTAIRNIGCVDALVSILSLQTSMYVCFGTGKDEGSHIMNIITGTAVCAMTFAIGISMIVSANRQKKAILDS